MSEQGTCSDTESSPKSGTTAACWPAFRPAFVWRGEPVAPTPAGGSGTLEAGVEPPLTRVRAQPADGGGPVHTVRPVRNSLLSKAPGSYRFGHEALSRTSASFADQAAGETERRGHDSSQKQGRTYHPQGDAQPATHHSGEADTTRERAFQLDVRADQVRQESATIVTPPDSQPRQSLRRQRAPRLRARSSGVAGRLCHPRSGDLASVRLVVETSATATPKHDEPPLTLLRA